MALPGLLQTTAPAKKYSKQPEVKELKSIIELESKINEFIASMEKEGKPLKDLKYMDYLKLDNLISPLIVNKKYGGFVYWSYTDLWVVMKLLDNDFKWEKEEPKFIENIDGVQVALTFTFLGKKSEVHVLTPMGGTSNNAVSYKYETRDKNGAVSTLNWRDVQDAYGRCLAKAVAFELGLGMRCWVQPKAVESMAGQEPVDYVPTVQVKPVDLGMVNIGKPFSPQVPPAPLGIPQNQPLPTAPAVKVAAEIKAPTQTIPAITGQAQVIQQVNAAFNPPQLPTAAPTPAPQQAAALASAPVMKTNTFQPSLETATVRPTVPQAPTPTPAPAPAAAPTPLAVVPAPTLNAGGMSPSQSFAIYLLNHPGFRDFAGKLMIDTFGKNGFAEFTDAEKLTAISEYEKTRQ